MVNPSIKCGERDSVGGGPAGALAQREAPGALQRRGVRRGPFSARGLGRSATVMGFTRSWGHGGTPK